MLIIGSRALQFYAQERGVPFRSPGDTDVICTEEEMDEHCERLGVTPTRLAGDHWTVETAPGRHMEFGLSHDGGLIRSGFDYLERAKNLPRQIQIAPLEILFSLKKSHIFIPRQWNKHIQDYHLMKSWGVKDVMPELTLIRRKEREAYKTPSLNKTADEFFDDNVSNKTFVHDDIHAVMAYLDKPMYERIKIDSNLVKCSRDKFEALGLRDRVRCVLEEAYVIALERAIIPMMFEGKKFATEDSAFNWALMRICTTLTSGWFREFAVENWPLIVKSRDGAYVKRFLHAVDIGKIRRINETAIPSVD